MSLLYLYIIIFSIYYVVLALLSLSKQKRVRDKYTSKDSNICVVLYASGVAGTLENLVKQFKNQTYYSDRYKLYVILDKVENPPEYIFQSDLSINVININNLEPIGKSQAYSILAEKMSEVKNLDAYVFMDANSYVDKDFLENVNYYLMKYDVFSPVINYIGEDNEFKFVDCVNVIYSRYISQFIYAQRTRLGLSNLINTDAFVIKHDLLNKIGSFDFKDKTSEVKYTLKLAQEDIPAAIINDVKIYREITDYDSRIPSISKRIGIFRQNFNKCKNFRAFEYVNSLAAPNWLVCILVYSLLIYQTYNFGSLKLLWLLDISYTTVLISAIVLLLAFSISLLNVNIYAKEYLYLFAYPLCSLGHLIINFPPVRGIRNFIKNRNQIHNIEKMATDIIVTDGKNDYNCVMELISDNGLSKVKFINGRKVYTTKNNHLRMTDAIRELSQKLNDYGLSLKVCQNCRYFQPLADGSTNMVKGTCSCKFEGRVDGDIFPTLIWNTCPYYEKQNVINLF